jgi:ubiquinone/menaquinone biosynthesis C-methylase UbiE
MRPHEGWQVSGTAAEAYERSVVPTLFTPWAHDLLTRAALQRGERVLDVACGTGIVARLAAAHVGVAGHVVGIDLNPGMLAVARAQTPASASAKVEWRAGDANALPCDDATFNVVFCQQGLQFFPDKARALREMHRVLAPGGRLALSVWRSLPYNPYNRALADAVARHVGPDAGHGMRAPCGFGDAQALRTLLTTVGFRETSIHIMVLTMRHPSPAAYIAGQLAALPFAGAIKALETTAQTALHNDILTALHPYIDDVGLAVPLESHIALARWRGSKKRRQSV